MDDDILTVCKSNDAADLALIVDISLNADIKLIYVSCH